MGFLYGTNPWKVFPDFEQKSGGGGKPYPIWCVETCMKEIDPKERKKVEDMVDQLIYRPNSEDKEKLDAEIKKEIDRNLERFRRVKKRIMSGNDDNGYGED
jgi:hypothetical protein